MVIHLASTKNLIMLVLPRNVSMRLISYNIVGHIFLNLDKLHDVRISIDSAKADGITWYSMKEIWYISEKGHISLLVSLKRVWGSTTIEQLLYRKTLWSNCITTQRQPIKWTVVQLYMQYIRWQWRRGRGRGRGRWLWSSKAKWEWLFTLLRYLIFGVRILFFFIAKFRMNFSIWHSAAGTRRSEFERIGLFCLIYKMISFFLNISSSSFGERGDFEEMEPSNRAISSQFKT